MKKLHWKILHGLPATGNIVLIASVKMLYLPINNSIIVIGLSLRTKKNIFFTVQKTNAYFLSAVQTLKFYSRDSSRSKHISRRRSRFGQVLELSMITLRVLTANRICSRCVFETTASMTLFELFYFCCWYSWVIIIYI